MPAILTRNNASVSSAGGGTVSFESCFGGVTTGGVCFVWAGFAALTGSESIVDGGEWMGMALLHHRLNRSFSKYRLGYLTLREMTGLVPVR